MNQHDDVRDMNARELLEQLQELGEHDRIEAKAASRIGHSIMETVCAFANEPNLGGGCLLLGVEEDQSTLFAQYRYSVIGVENPDKLSNDLSSQCRSTFNLPVAVRIKAEKLDGKIVLLVSVPEVAPADKPIYFPKVGLPNGALRRVGAADVQCSEDDLSVLYSGRSHATFDEGVLPDAEMDDLDEDAIEDYRRERAKADANAEELNWNDEELLRALSCVRKVDGEPKPTVAGVLLFGSKMALRRLFPMMRVDYIRVPGKEWVRDPEKRFDSIDMRDPIMRLVRRATAAILDDLPSAFSLPADQTQREVSTLVDPRVWREAIVNALMHRSYRHHGAVQIIRYSNRLEIRNAGYSLKPPERLGEPESLTRNPRIAAVLHDTRFAETKGSGVRVMRELMEQAGLSAPLFESSRASDNFVATFFFHHFLSPEDWQWLGAFKEHLLSNEEARALVFVRENGAIDNLTYRNLNKVDPLEASRHLVRLRECNLLERKGSGNKTFYVPGSNFAPFPLPEDYGAKPIELETEPTEFEGIPTELEVKPTEFGGKDGELPAELQAAVLALGKKPRLPEMEAVIVRLCAHRAYTLSDLGRLLNRNAGHLKRQYITRLVSQGRLKYLYPENRTHPAQAYRTPNQS